MWLRGELKPGVRSKVRLPPLRWSERFKGNPHRFAVTPRSSGCRPLAMRD